MEVETIPLENINQLTDFFVSMTDVIMISLHAVFEYEWVPVLLALIMLSIAVLIIVWAKIKTFLPILKAIKKAKNSIASLKTRNDFRNNYNDVDEQMSQCQFLRHGWKEFDETLVKPETNDRDEPIRNTERPHDYLTIECLEKSGVHLSFWKAVPNYFVGFGLLFTFIGLVVALDSAAEGVSGGDVDKTQEALKDLLNAATFKFFTSIAGIMGSLATGIAIKRSIYKIEKGFLELSALIESKLLWISPQSIAGEQLKELKTQSSELQHFNQDFGIQLSQTLEKVLDSTFAPLTKAMDKMSGNVQSIQMDSINSALENVHSSMSGAAGNEMEAMVKAMENVRTSLESTTDELKTQMGQVGQSFGDKVSGAADTLDPFTSEMSRFNNNIEQLSERIDDQKNALSGVVDKIHDAAASIDIASKHMREAGDPVVKTAEKMSRAADRVSDAMTSIESLQTALSSMTEKFEDSSESMKESWEDYQSRFSDVDLALKNTIEQVIDGTISHQEGMKNFVTELDRSFKEAVTALAGGIQELSETVEEMNAS